MATIFDHILIPLDFTEKNRAALDVAIEIGRQHPGRVTLLHVIEMIEEAEDPDSKNFYSMLETKARGKLQELAKAFESRGGAPAQEIVYGKRVAEIVRYAMGQEVTLVVMSSRKIELDAESPDWATLSHQVSILCQCPVLLVK